MHPAATLSLKLVLTPCLIGLVTVTARRWGPAVGGWLAGLPLTSGPVSLFLALEQGPAFASQAASGTLLGLIAMALFCLVYGWAARRAGWPGSLAAGLSAFTAGTWLGSAVPLSPAAAFGSVVVALGLIGRAMPCAATAPAPPAFPRWEVPARMLVATGFVLALTALATALGPRASGLVSPVPIFAAVLAVFTHRGAGAAAATRLLHGVVIGSFGFACFFLVVGVALEPLGLAPAYILATLAALTVHGASLRLVARRA